VFDHGGRLEVTLTVTDNDGITGTITRYITVEINNPPTAGFTYEPESPTTADMIEFTNTSRDSDGIILTYLWSFGDSQTSTIQTPSHRYGETGAYTITLKVTDNDGAQGITTKTLVVSEAPDTLTANFKFSPERPSVDQDVTFTDLSTVQEATIVSWVWAFGDGSAPASQRNPVHRYSTGGPHSVSLTVTDSLGREASLSKQVIVGAGGEEDVQMMAYPNPASRSATVNYFLPDGATGPRFWIYDLGRNQILRLDLEADTTEFAWNLLDNDGTSVSNGLYFCFITATSAAGRTITSDVFRLLIAR
jgi:PKD repeat protein